MFTNVRKVARNRAASTSARVAPADVPQCGSTRAVVPSNASRHFISNFFRAIAVFLLLLSCYQVSHSAPTVKAHSASVPIDGDCDGLSPLAQKVFTAINKSEVIANSPVDASLLYTRCNTLEKVLVDGPEIFRGLREALTQANYAVDMAFFTWDEDSDAAKLIGEGLKIASERAKDFIVVRIMINESRWDMRTINGLYNATKKWNLNPSKAIVQLATFPHTGLGALHDKMVVIDGTTLFVSGANAQKHNDAGHPWHDTGYIFKGEVARAGLNSFDRAWDDAKHWSCKQRRFEFDCLEIGGHIVYPRSWWSAVPKTTGTVPLLAIGREARELPNNDNNNPQNRAWLTAISEARKTINIETPNINEESFQDAIVDAALRGVTVRLLTGKRFNDKDYGKWGMPGATNLQAVGRLRQKMWRAIGRSAPLQVCWYSEDGVHPLIGNYAGANHTKFMSVDGQIAIVGSGNMDWLSWQTSHEFNVLIDSAKEVARIEDAFFNKDWANANCAVAELYEGNDTEQELVCSEPLLYSHSRNFRESELCANDEGRSLAIHEMPAGRVIRLYDSPTGQLNDEWLEVVAKRDIKEKRIGTLQRSFEDDDVSVRYHGSSEKNNALDGKVSRITIGGESLGPIIDLYEDNYAGGNLVCSIRSVVGHEDNLRNGSLCSNDEARAIRLWDMPANRAIWFYDSPSGNTDDDWMVIRTKRHIGQLMISSFEKTFSNDDVEVYYFQNDGMFDFGGKLDGKVSRVEITEEANLPGYISLYEGKGATQSKVCDLRVYDRTVKFKQHDKCDNDEVKSVVLTNVKAGTTVYLYDSPDCDTDDDWTKIEAKKDVSRYTVNSVEQDTESTRVEVNHHHDNGLAGKVSCVRIRAP